MSGPLDSGAGPESFSGADSPGVSESGGGPVSNQSSTQTPGRQESTGINPVWAKALEGIPNEFHKPLQEHFGRWDKNYQDLNQRYTPYKSFVDQGISPDLLQQAWGIRELLNNNPQEVYRRLHQALGMDQQQQQFEEQDGESQDPDLEEQNDPRYDEIRRQQQELANSQQQMMKFVQQRAYEEQTQAAEREIESELDNLRRQHGDFDVVDVLRRAAQMDSPDVTRALQEQQQFLQKEFQRTRSTANTRAPLVQPTNGGFPPSAEKNPAQYTKAERTAAFGAMMNAANQKG